VGVTGGRLLLAGDIGGTKTVLAPGTGLGEAYRLIGAAAFGFDRYPAR